MYVKSEEVKVYCENLFCECGGEFVFTGDIYPTYPEQYKHKCNKCGNVEITYCRYPKITYKKDNGDDLK